MPGVVVANEVAVIGPVTDAEIRAAPVPVSDGGGSLTVDGPLTDAQLRAAAVPVSAASLPLPAGAATQATLATLLTQATGAAIEVILTAIRDTAGIKKITDQLPAGTNNIGDVDVVSSALPAGAATEASLLTRLTEATFAARINTLGQKLMAASTPVVLASDQTAVPITTSGAGEEQTFTALASTVVLGNNKSMLALFNPAASGYTIKLREIYLRNAQTTAVTGVAAAMQLHAIRGGGAAVTAGTAVTPIAHDSNDTLPAGLVCVTGGTVAGETATPLDVMRISSDEWGPGTLDVEAHHHGFENYMPARVKRDSVMKPFFCRPGQGIHIKCATNTTAGRFDIILIFTRTTP